ncbi:MAG: hypothetical protein GQE15_28230 [Archangiaceae bacterium]|nr:hypothetical protein [Archangiaceae bacterium]
MNRSLFAGFFLLSAFAFAQAPDSRFSAGGYYRISARPDFQGGNGRLGFWNLHGRLMNEGTYAALEMKLDLLQAPPGTTDIWASLHARVEGGTVSTADPLNGFLNNFRMSQLYARAGNILAPNIIWQLGTQQFFFGDLGLYDFRPAQLFEDTIGISGRYQSQHLDVLLTVGDSGFAQRGAQYVPILTAGGAVRVHVNDHFEVGGGGQVGVEPFIAGNRFSSYVTPNVRYEDYLRKEVLRRYLEENPGMFDQFQRPQQAGQMNTSWRAVGYLGFGGFGPLRWNNFFARYQRLHPQNFYSDSWNGQSVTVYTADLTRDRYVMQLGDEVQLNLVKDWLDLAVAGIYGTDRDYADTISASEANRQYMSVVGRFQLYLTRVVHVLLETSLAQERSINGNLFRGSFDSIFRSSGGLPDSRGLEFGDQNVRNTLQLKTGLVLNPTGRGIYNRPSIRLLYGFQYSTMHAAFGNAFAERLDQFNVFSPSSTIAWHHLISLESEGWF